MISFTVLGIPKPQGSKRAYVNKHTGRAQLVDQAGAPLQDWRVDVQQAAIIAMDGRPPYDCPIYISLRFHLQRPKSHPKNRQTWPATRPDIDKLARAVLDALTHICFHDDGQVVFLSVAKAWGTPGVNVYFGDSRVGRNAV